MYMKKVLLSLAIASSIYAQDISINDGWQLLGATEDLNISKFNNSCVDYIWKYDTGNWKLHIANGQTYSYTGATISTLTQGQGFWVKGNNNCSVTTSIDLDFTNEMLNNRTFYNTWSDDYNDAIYGVVKRSFNENSMIVTDTDEYDYKLGDVNMTLNNGNINYIRYGYKYDIDLTSKNSDYLKYSTTKYYESNNSVAGNYNGRLYNDETKAFDYQKTFEVYNSTFFNTGVAFTKPEVIEHVNLTKLDNSNIGVKTRFYNYGIDGNGYTLDTTSITLTATPTTDGSKSSMKGYLRNKPLYYKGIAVDVNTINLDANRRQRIKIQINGYNDGTQDINPAIQILQDKIVYYQWQEKTADDDQTLDYWTTVLDGIDFNNKEVKLAVWVKDAKVHFYAECEGSVGYETYDISGFENHSLENSHWSIYKVEVKDGGDTTSANFTKIYTLR